MFRKCKLATNCTNKENDKILAKKQLLEPRLEGVKSLLPRHGTQDLNLYDFVRNKAMFTNNTVLRPGGIEPAGLVKKRWNLSDVHFLMKILRKFNELSYEIHRYKIGFRGLIGNILSGQPQSTLTARGNPLATVADLVLHN